MKCLFSLIFNILLLDKLLILQNDNRLIIFLLNIFNILLFRGKILLCPLINNGFLFGLTNRSRLLFSSINFLRNIMIPTSGFLVILWF